MELFIAIGLSRALSKNLHSFAVGHLDDMTPELPEDLHITMRYLGDTERVNETLESLKQIAFAPFTIRLSKIDAFENVDGNVIWYGLDDPDGFLPRLRTKIDLALTGCPCAKHQNAYVPHITLAYTRQNIDRSYLSSLAFTDASQPLFIDCFELWRVLPSACPNRFQKLATFRLSETNDRRTVRLLCVNDFHAALRESDTSLGAAKLAAAVHSYVQTHGNTTIVFGGDNCFGNPVSELYGGAPVIEWMRSLGVRASVAGNHDFDFSVDTFASWETHGGFPLLAANLAARSTKQPPPFIRPYCIIVSGGIKIALIGLATVEPMDGPDRPKDWRQYELTSGTAAARKWVDYLLSGNDPAGRPDCIIALTHFGLRQTHEGKIVGDEFLELTQNIPELDAAFTAHWHQFLQTECNGLPVAQGGSTGRGFSVVALTFDPDKRLLSAMPLSFDLMREKDGLPEDTTSAEIVERYFCRARERMGQIVATASEAVIHRDPQSHAIPLTGTPLTKLATDVMCAAAGCPIALLYAGRIGAGFSKGPISLYDFYKVFLFSNTLVTMSLTGEQLHRNIEIGMRTLSRDGASPLAISGLTVTIDPGLPYGERVLDVRLPNGTPLEPDTHYPVVLEDYLAGDPLGFRFSDGTKCRYLTLSLRKLLLETLAQQRVLIPKSPENIIIRDTERNL